MKVRAQIGMVLNLDKCIGCHTCSVTCKNVWTSREGVEYACSKPCRLVLIEAQAQLQHNCTFQTALRFVLLQCERGLSAGQCVLCGRIHVDV